MSDIYGKLSRLAFACCLAMGVASPALAEEGNLRVDSVTADNRGFVIVEFNCPIRPFAFNSDPATVTLRGDDGSFMTDDDVEVSSMATRVGDNSVLEIRADVPADEPYRVVLNSNLIISDTGRRLDGEFNGPSMESGDGEAGGDLEFFTRPPAVTVARLTTSVRFIDVELFPGATPLTVQNFLAYANAGDWDGTFFHRAVDDFVIQGGGFMTNASFDKVTERDPVPNEPGISNLRGTIAMAKLPGNPDSATNQWFFNLSDNSENLDDQNGGFTVFGEVLDAQSLNLVDDIGQLPTVDASDIDGAFTDVPIMNLADFVERGEMLIPEDVVEIERIAILQDISSEPSVSFNTENADIVRSETGDAMVMVFDVAGQPIPGGMFEVDFYDNGNSVRSVTLDEGMPADRQIAISITSEEPIGTIKDKRRNDPRDIAFIHATTTIERIKLNSGIAGANINGVRLPDGSTLPIDIDGDGGSADPTAILVQSGTLFRVDIDGDVVGDIVAPVAPFSIKVKGDVRNCSMTFDEAEERTGLRVQFDRGENVLIETPGELNNLKATDLRTTDMRFPSRIVAARINSIKIRGDRRNDIDGDFECDITTTGGDDEDTVSALRNLKVAGDIRDSIFDFDTDVFGSIKCDGDIVDCSITIDGIFARGLKVRQLTRTDFNINGQMGNLKAAQVRGGQLIADTVKSVKVKGDRRANLDGDFSMDMLIENPDGEENPIGSIRIDGDLLDSNTTIMGSMRSLVVKGDIENSSWSIEGDVRTIRAGRVRDSELDIEQSCRMISVTDWNGGELNCNELRLLNINGDRRNGIPGDLTRFDTSIGVLDRMQVSTDGRLFDCNINIFRGGDIRIDGDVIDSEFRLNQLVNNNSFEFVVLDSFEIKGVMDGSFIRARETIRDIEITRMVDSSIFVGAPSPTVQGFPISADNLDENSNIGSLTIRGDDGDEGMDNSFVVCATLGSAFVFQPVTNNPVGEFGLSYTNLTGDILVVIDGQRIFLDEREGSFRSGDFQVRSFHQAPELP